MRISTRKTALIGILAGITIFLGQTNLGFIPVPTGTGALTILQIPTIVGSIIGGPLVGGFTGLIFGIYTFIYFGYLAPNVIVLILPKVLMGILAFYLYRGFKISNLYVKAGIVAGICTAFHSIMVLGLAWLFNYATLPMILPGLFINMPLEIVLSLIVVGSVVPRLEKIFKKEK